MDYADLMVIVEPLVSEEKLRQLLDEQAESASLDYKSECDLREKADVVEFAKDIGAMQIDGGFLVIGADNRGRPTNKVTSGHAKLFDEAALRAKLRKWIPDQVDLMSAVHEIEGSPIVLVFVGANREGLAVFAADGQYVVEGRQVTVFRKGDVFARHGTASEPWNQGDIARVFERIIARRKEEWRRTLAVDFARLGEGTEARQLASAPAQALTWNLDSASFEAAIIEQLRVQDDIPLRLLLEQLPSDAAALAHDEGLLVDLPTLFDRLICLGALGLRLERPRVVDAAIDAAGLVYDVGFSIERAPQSWAIPAATFWLDLLVRILALGALAVRKKNWDAVRQLALRQGETDDWRHFRTWLRHGFTMAARSKLFIENEDGREVERSVLSLANRAAGEVSCLRPDLAADDERLLNSLCQFDALAALAMISETRSLSNSHFYPNFARFYSHRTEPAIARLLVDDAMRLAIFPLPDDVLASALRGLDRMAQREAFRFAGWDGFTDALILGFLQKNPAPNESTE